MNRRMKTSLLTGLWVLLCLLHAEATPAQTPSTPSTPSTNGTADTTSVTFRFLPGEDMFYIPWAGNSAELERLYALTDKYRTEIAAGTLPVYVDAYCASLPTAKENLQTAFVRANRVKSELITHKGLKEANFITANHARAYLNHKDMVVVTLRIPAKENPDDNARLERERREQAERERQAQAEREQAERAQAEREQTERQRAQAEAERIEREKAEAERIAREQAEADALQRHTTEPAATAAKPYCIALRTNLLYDAFLLPTLGIEWRISQSLGVKLDGSLSRWGGSAGKVQKIWMLNPEVRWYLLRDKRFYVGASGSYGEYNIYKYMIGNLMKDDTGYQGKLWNAGLTLGYQLRLSRSFSVDFNLGLGYTRSSYDSFTLIDATRVYKDRAKTKHIWGPTQAGISLVWTIGGNK